jgi:hypothetical protein
MDDWDAMLVGLEKPRKRPAAHGVVKPLIRRMVAHFLVAGLVEAG